MLQSVLQIAVDKHSSFYGSIPKSLICKVLISRPRGFEPMTLGLEGWK